MKPNDPAAALAAPPGARRIEYVLLQDVAPATRNVKLHDGAGIRASMGRFGFIEPIVMDERTGRLVAGHGRLAQLQALRAKAGKTGAAKGGPPEGILLQGTSWAVPVVRGWSSATDADAEAYLVASNRLAERGGWDQDALVAMLGELEQVDVDLPQLAGFPDVEIAALLTQLQTHSGPGTARGAAVLAVHTVPAAPTEPITAVGDLLELGPHRLLVGPGTEQQDVRRVMGRHKGAVLWSRTHEPVHLITAVLQAVHQARALQVGAGFYLAHRRLDPALTQALQQEPWHLRQHLIWLHEQPRERALHYRGAYEPIAFGRYDPRPGAGEKPAGSWYGPATRLDVWDSSEVDLIAAQLSDVARRGQHVLDPFAGTGSSVLAAHTLGLVAHVIAASPAAADVIAARYQHLSGQQPLRDGLPQDFPLSIDRADPGAQVVATAGEVAAADAARASSSQP